jgi:asparagine synthase (glutamine-hydrolysing)
MRGLLAVSVAAGAPAPPESPAIRRLDDPEAALTHRFDDGWVAFTGPDDDDRLPAGPGGGFTVRLTRSVRGPRADAGTGELATLLGDGSALDGEALSGLLPPFAAAHRPAAGAPTVVAGDWLGLRQLFWWQSGGVAAVSTSPLALAALAGSELDPRALGVQSLLGWQVGLATGFAGVSKLAPGCAAVLHRGRVEVRRYAPESLAADAPRLPLDGVVDEMAAVLRDLVRRYLLDHPKTVLQLSGGQDSRLLLSAVPAELRAGLRAMTLDVRGGAEARVASRLRDGCGLAHDMYWLDEWPPVDPPTGYRAAIGAATALGGLASPLALGPLTLIEARLEQGHRFTGTGGETARGFYYPGQPRNATTSARLVRRLADWRLFTNEAVEPAALDPDFAGQARTAALEAVGACFEQYDTDWLRATDEFYLWQRVQRWAGAHDTPAAVDRHNVNPLLDRRFLQLALVPSPAEKRNSRLTGRVIQRLSPRLATIPLDSGLVPARLARPGVAGTAAVTLATVRKTAGKVLQRIRGTRRSQLGAAELAGLVVTHWRAHPDLVAPVRRTGLVRDGWLDELLDSRREAQPTTVAFLVNLLVLAETAGQKATAR